MIKVVCDRCGREIPMPGKTGYLAWNFREGHGGGLVGDNVLEGRDYCEACMGTIFDFIDRVPDAVDGRERGVTDTGVQEIIPGRGDPDMGVQENATDSGIPDPEAVHKAPEDMAVSPDSSAAAGKKRPGQQGRARRAAKKEVDAGKVMALISAGRSARWVADDMGISLQSVYNVLNRARKQDGGGEDAEQDHQGIGL